MEVLPRVEGVIRLPPAAADVSSGLAGKATSKFQQLATVHARTLFAVILDETR